MKAKNKVSVISQTRGKRGNPAAGVIEINGNRFEVHYEVVGYGKTGNMLPIYNYFVKASPDYNQSSGKRYGNKRTLALVVKALEAEQNTLVKPAI